MIRLLLHYRLTITCFSLILALGSAQVWLAHLRVENNRTIQNVQNDITATIQEIQKLKLELSSMTRPETLRQLARKELGMRPPLPMQVIRP